jgi:glycosyltransferase involved in cell wall biosynthesis
VDASNVTAVVLTRDEDRNLPRALTGLPRGTSALILDCGSKDHTVEFARSWGARVIERPWTDFVDARLHALAQVRTPWAFMLDADEALDDVLRDAMVGAGEDVDAYRIYRTTYFCGKPMRLWSREPLLRLFKRDRVVLQAFPAGGGSAALHERWMTDGPVRDLDGTLLHYSYPDVATYRAKYDRYTSTEAAGLPRSLPRFLSAASKGVLRFGHMLLVRGALLDGWRGVYVAYRSAMYPAVVAWKAFRGPSTTALRADARDDGRR